MAVEVVRVAFRVGVLVDKMARCIEPWEFDARENDNIRDTRTDVTRKGLDGERPSWTLLMAGLGTEEALRQFNEENNVSLTFSSQHPPPCDYADRTSPFLLAVLYDTPMDQRPINGRHCRCQWPAQFTSPLRCMGTVLEARTAEASTFADFRALSCTASLQP